MQSKHGVRSRCSYTFGTTTNWLLQFLQFSDWQPQVNGRIFHITFIFHRLLFRATKPNHFVCTQSRFTYVLLAEKSRKNIRLSLEVTIYSYNNNNWFVQFLLNNEFRSRWHMWTIKLFDFDILTPATWFILIGWFMRSSFMIRHQKKNEKYAFSDIF